jgi:hypothetical protein
MSCILVDHNLLIPDNTQFLNENITFTVFKYQLFVISQLLKKNDSKKNTIITDCTYVVFVQQQHQKKYYSKKCNFFD